MVKSGIQALQDIVRCRAYALQQIDRLGDFILRKPLNLAQRLDKFCVRGLEIERRRREANARIRMIIVSGAPTDGGFSDRHVEIPLDSTSTIVYRYGYKRRLSSEIVVGAQRKITMLLFLLICAGALAFILFGIQAQPVSIPQISALPDALAAASPQPSFNIKIKEAPNELEFERTYSAQLDNRAKIEIRMKRYIGRLFETGSLTQPNGNWISFDPDRIAEKIIDPLLVPLVQKAVDEIHRIDAAFRNPPPAQFTDSQGRRWALQN